LEDPAIAGEPAHNIKQVSSEASQSADKISDLISEAGGLLSVGLASTAGENFTISASVANIGVD
jgi:hypothetical protein